MHARVPDFGSAAKTTLFAGDVEKRREASFNILFWGRELYPE
jgi:hypothetical protein